jgi:ABC-type transport system substrate-binding protein
MQKLVVGSFILLLVTLGWGDRGGGEQSPEPQGELRVVDRHHYNWAFIVYNVIEHLIEFDRDGTLEPRLATGWRWLDDRTLEMTLRQGVTFHNGEVFDAEIVKLNWDENTRLKQPFVSGAYMNFKSGAQLEIIDLYTVRFHFPEPDGGALARLSTLHMANRQFHRELGGWGEKGW